MRENAIQSLKALFPPDQIVASSMALLTYEGDASLDKGLPDAVVFPQTAYDVARLARWSVEHGVPLIARGAGTGLSGGAVAEHGGVIVEFSRMNRITEFDEAGRSVVFEPGVVNLVLDGLAKSKGLYYPPDPASGRASTLGGNMAENAGGPHCFKYGVTANYITGMDVVLADGQAVRLGGRALDVPEYDLIGILTGSEGTLGIITSASARLLRNPPAIKTMMAAFNSVEEAGEAVSAIIARGLVPATMEMMDQKMMQIIEDFVHPGLPVEAGAALIIETDGYAESVGPQLDEIIDILQAHGGFHLHVAETAEERDKIWYGRKSAAGAMARLSPAFYLVDGTVPRSHLAETLAGVNRICIEAGLRVSYVFHAGDGNLHPFILIENPNDKDLIRRVVQAGRDILALCCAFDGTITGEHGVGIEKREFMPLQYSADELAVMRDIKAVFDPAGLLNPNKIFPTTQDTTSPRAQPMTPPPASPLQGEGGWEQHVAPLPPPSLRGKGDGGLGPAVEVITVAPTNGNLPAPFVPPSAAEAAEAIRAWTTDGLTVRLRGGGTKSALLAQTDMTLSTQALMGISRYALADLYVTAGAGTPLSQLQAELARDGMWVPLASPWPDATLGGILSTAFNAPLRMRYGGARDLMLAATVALADGRVIRAGRPVVKNVAGYDLPKLMVGAWGTLGLLTDVTLKLAPLPRARRTLLIPVADVARGLAVGARLLPVCLVASSLLLVAGDAAGADVPYLAYTAEGYAEDVNIEIAQVQASLRALGVIPVEGDVAGTEVWAGWLRGVWGRRLVARVGIAPKDLPRYLTGVAPKLESASYVADLGAGLLYTAHDGAVQTLREPARALGGYAVVLSAPPSAAPQDVWGYIPEGLSLMHGLRAKWDPQRRLNPGAFVV